eukprot:1004301_1
MGCCVTKNGNVSLHRLSQRNTQAIIPTESIRVLRHGWLEKQSTSETTWAVLTHSTLYTFKSQYESSLFEHGNGKSYLKMTPGHQADVTDRMDLHPYKLIESIQNIYQMKHLSCCLHPIMIT